MPKKKLPAIVDTAVWGKVTKWRAGIRWDSVVEKVWKGTGGNKEEVMSVEKFGRYKAEAEERIERRERLALRDNVKPDKHLPNRNIRGFKRRRRNENVFARPDGLREKVETAILRK